MGSIKGVNRGSDRFNLTLLTNDCRIKACQNGIQTTVFESDAEYLYVRKWLLCDVIDHIKIQYIQAY